MPRSMSSAPSASFDGIMRSPLARDGGGMAHNDMYVVMYKIIAYLYDCMK